MSTSTCKHGTLSSKCQPCRLEAALKTIELRDEVIRILEEELSKAHKTIKRIDAKLAEISTSWESAMEDADNGKGEDWT